MKIIYALFAFMIVLTGCSANNSIVTQADLLHRNYVLINFDGQAVESENWTPNIEFGESLFVSGVMCNNFSGWGRLSNGILKVENMIQTRAICIDNVRNELDTVIAQMLTTGAQITLLDKTLTLKNENHQLVFDNRDWIR